MAREINSSNGLACCKMLEAYLGLKAERKLGEGGQGSVLLCHQPATGRRFACKAIASHGRRQPQTICSSSKLDVNILQQMSPQEAAQNDGLRWEAEVMERLRGLPYILPISAKAESDDGCMHIFTPVCDGGDLHARLADSAGGVFPEREAAYVVARLGRALLSCHRQGIVHLDLKPANVLFRSRMFDISTLPNSLTANEAKAVHDNFVRRKQQQPASSYHVFLADFGHAASLEYIEPGLQTRWPREPLHDPNVGTLPFNAPEVIRKCYDHRADIWSLGLILHFMLTSQLPSFLHRLPRNASDAAIRRAILSFDSSTDNISMQDDALLLEYGVSPSAQSLLRGMLCKDPASRITLQQLLKHPWVTGNYTNPELHAPICKPAGRSTGRNNRINMNDVAASPPAVSYSPRNYKAAAAPININGMQAKAEREVPHVTPAPPAVTSSLETSADSCRIITAMEFKQGITVKSKCVKKRKLINMDIQVVNADYMLLQDDEEVEEAFPRFTRIAKRQYEVQQKAAGAQAPGFSCIQQQNNYVWSAVAAHQTNNSNMPIQI